MDTVDYGMPQKNPTTPPLRISYGSIIPKADIL